ncbi:hypothetical protein [Butyrivibrio hungatei]|uniref:Uncharacterized protein n=1 Tax=Butyrivibrio hungatei TaxID=185008 RepID=A0A1D9P0J0_9FIRM|nr:hypothetical protein [Butyrivibrio hungatei]AOZ96070.1 hypothetical protein bhn_I1036 [Butyrivibrio hungatei]
MSEVIQMAKAQEVHFYKPNMGALRGKIGESILETIRNTPRPDHSALKKEADEYLKARMAEKKA